MAGVQVVTRKLTSFQGRDEEWTNVYYFGNGAIGPAGTSEQHAEEILDWCIAREKTIHADPVRFLGGYVRQLGLLNNPVEGESLYSKELQGLQFGTFGIENQQMYRECAVMLRWLLGGRRYLRSMLHTHHPHGYQLQGFTSTAVANLSAPLKAFADAMLTELPNGYRRRAPNGDVPSAVAYHPYLEHRQYHEGRRRRS